MNNIAQNTTRNTPQKHTCDGRKKPPRTTPFATKKREQKRVHQKGEPNEAMELFIKRISEHNLLNNTGVGREHPKDIVGCNSNVYFTTIKKDVVGRVAEG